MRLLLFAFLLSATAARADVDVEYRYYEDKSASLSAEEIVARADQLSWTPVSPQGANFGPTKSRYWFRFRVPERKLEVDQPAYVLEIGNAYLRKVGFYRAIQGKVEFSSFSGQKIPVSQRGSNVLRVASTSFRISADQPPGTEFFVSAESTFPLRVPLRMMGPSEFAFHHWTQVLFLGIFFGVIILAAGFNGFLAISLKSRLYRNYALFVATIGMAHFAHEGLSVQLLWPEAPWWGQRDIYVFGGLALLFYSLFVREFLDSPRFTPRLDLLLKVLVGMNLGAALWLLFSIDQPVAILCQTTVWISNLLVLIIALKALVRGVKSAQYFLLSSLFFNLSVVLFQLQEMGVFHISPFLDKAVNVGVMLEVLLLSFALADRIRQVRLELDRQRAAVQHAEKMSALGRMAGEIAHEISNPLAIIHGNAVLARKLEPPAEIRDIVGTIEQTANRITKVVKGIRALARDSRGDPLVRVPVHSVLQDAVSLCEERARQAGVLLEVPRAESDLAILCRSSEICQVLVNLLNNAFDAVEGMPARSVTMDMRVKGRVLELGVTDSGPGVPKELRSRLAEPFFTTKAAGKGLGLGLSISRTIVEAHGGRIWLDEESPATRFAFTVPLSSQMHRPS